MKKTILFLSLTTFILLSSGCIPLIIGGAAGALGARAISKDTIQGETDKSYDSLWKAAYQVSKIRGTIRQEDNLRGYLRVDVGLSRVKISLIRLTRATTRLRITARKYHFPDLDLAQDLFVKIMEEAK